MGIDNTSKSYGPYTKSEKYPGQTYAERTKYLLDAGTLTEHGNWKDWAWITGFNRWFNDKTGFGSATPIAEEEWGGYKDQTNAELYETIYGNRGPIGESAWQKINQMNTFNHLREHNMLDYDSKQLTPPKALSWQDFQLNKDLYNVKDNPIGDSKANYEAMVEWEKMKDAPNTSQIDPDASALDTGVHGFLGEDPNMKENYTLLSSTVFEGFDVSGLSMHHNEGKVRLDLNIAQLNNPNSAQAKFLKAQHPLNWFLYNEAKDKRNLIARKVKNISAFSGEGEYARFQPTDLLGDALTLNDLEKAEKELAKAREALFLGNLRYNEDGTLSGAVIPVNVKEAEALQNQAADNSLAYQVGGFGNIALELVPVIGVGGALIPGLFKSTYKGVKLVVENGKLLSKSFDDLVNTVGKREAQAISDQLTIGNRKYKYNANTGKMDITNPNEAYMTFGKEPGPVSGAPRKDLPKEMEAFWKKSQKVDLYKGKKWSDLDKDQRKKFKIKYDKFVESGVPLDDVIFTEKHITYPKSTFIPQTSNQFTGPLKLPKEMEAFWKKAQQLDIYKGKTWDEIGRVARANFKKKYDRFVSQGVSVDDVVVKKDGAGRLIFPETYSTKSPYPYAPTLEVGDGKRVRGAVSFSHIENGAQVEEKFGKMVTELYSHPVHSKTIPDRLSIDKFNELFFGGEKSDDYVSTIVSAYARNKGLSSTRPVLGLDEITKRKAEWRLKNIKENGNYAFENKIKGSDDINLHHSATITRTYTPDDLMYIDSFVNQQTLTHFESQRTKLLAKQKKAGIAYNKNPTAANKKVLEDLNEEFLEVIGNKDTYSLLSAPLANFNKNGDLFLSEFKFTREGSKILDTTGIFKGKKIGELNLIEKVVLDFNRPLKKVAVDNKGKLTNTLVESGGKLLDNKDFVIRFDDTIEGPLDASINYLINRSTVARDPFFKKQQAEWLKQNPGKNSDDALNAIKEHIKNEAINMMKEYGVIQMYKDGGRVRKYYASGTRNNTVVGDEITGETIYGKYLDNLNIEAQKTKRDKERIDQIMSAPESMRTAVATVLHDDEQTAFLEEIREMPSAIRAKFKQKIIDSRELKRLVAEQLADPRPTRWPLKSIPKLVTGNPLFKSIASYQAAPGLIFTAFLDDLLNRGVDPEQAAPNISEIVRNYTVGTTEATPPEQAYIDGFDEINRALETGISNLSYNTMDLVLGGIDLASFGKTDLSSKLRDMYENRDVNEPETFLGEMTALLVEFGVPGGVVAKILTRAQKALRMKGFNTMTRYVNPELSAGAQRLIGMSNIASRTGTGAVIFGAADFVAGGPYNTLQKMFPEDATLLPGKPEETDDLMGDQLAAANFRNRVRFAADGAMIGALFPLLGPPIWGLAKGIGKLPFKTIPGLNRSVVGGGLQLAGIPLRIAADVLAGKVPYTQKMIPVVGKGISKVGEKTASGAQAAAAFVGKNVFARAALATQDLIFARDAIYSGINRGTTFFRGIPKVFGGEGGGLPAFQDWRKFSVNSADPLHANLARIDNKLALFRDIGKFTKEAFGISTEAKGMIKSKNRTIDKMYTQLEGISYHLAKKFEEQHQKWGQFSTIQKKYLDEVLDYIQGYKKLSEIDPPLRKSAQELKQYTRKLKHEFKDLLLDGDKLKFLLTKDIDSQMRRSFAMFTNANFRPGADAVKAARDYIARYLSRDKASVEQARIAFPEAKSLDEAIQSLAELRVGDLMHIARYEMEDPIRAFRKIVSRLEKSNVPNLPDPLEIYTGQELPAVMRKLMGEETSLKNTLLQTTGNIVSSTQQKMALDRLAKLGLENKWLFRDQTEALNVGKIYDSIPVTDIKGAGFLPSDIIGLHGAPEMVKQLSGYSIFDSALKYKFYQNLLAFKSMVQGGKTLYSPATQMRNFGSAGLFAMNVGHIGGNTSVTQNFKIMLDDIFGSGPGVDEGQMIRWLERKIELGVLDENVVANELGGILKDLKGVVGVDGKPIISNFNQFTQKIGDSKLTQTVQRLYAGGDNVWKAYGHEFYISELKQFTKNLDDVHRFFETQVGRKWNPLRQGGADKTLAEGIEEMAAHLLRETYPTYSRVPPVIQALRKLPLGNFISFPAEMIRTSLATTASSMKMIGSGNPGLQAMGYRALMGQFTTLYGFNHGAQKLASHMTGVNEDKLRAYQDDLGPAFIEDHILIPITKQKDDGTFKVFDASTYNPYNYLIGPVESFIRQMGTQRLDPAQVDSELDRRFFDSAGPFMRLLDPFVGETIALEPILDIFARNGVTRDGKKIFSPTDSPSDKREKAIYHTLETIAPGFVRSAGQVWGALSLDTKGGRVMDIGDVLIRLMGGSIMNIDPVTALDYKALDIRKIRSAAFQTEHFFSKENALERGPILDKYGRQTGHVMANEFRDIQDEAFVAQFGIWKMFEKSLASGLLTKKQIENILGKKGRNVPNLDNLLDGKFTPISYSASGLKQRASELIKEYDKAGITLWRNDLFPKYDLDNVIREYKRRRFEDFLDPNRPSMPEIPFNPTESEINESRDEADNIPVAPLDTTAFEDTQVASVPTQTVAAPGSTVNQQTGLTRNETALLSPNEQLIRKTQRNII